MNIPCLNTNDDKVDVVQWHVDDGGYVEAGQELVDLETSKAISTLVTEITGYVRSLVKKGDVAKVGAPLCLIATTKEELDSPAKADHAPVKEAPIPVKDDPVKAEKESAPVMAAHMDSTEIRHNGSKLPDNGGPYAATRFSKGALRLIEERGWNPSDFRGAGLVTVHTINGRTGRSRFNTYQAIPANRIVPSVSNGPETGRKDKVSLAKQAEIQCLSIGESGNLNSELSLHFDSARIRARLQNEHIFDGSILPLILFEISRLLKQWPQFTAYFEENIIHYYDRIDLGVAIDLGKGLKVVTIKDADKLMPIDFFEKTIDIGTRYIENRIQPEELSGSTLTITDLSGLDILAFHPLINGHQSTIIGLGGDSSRIGHPMSIIMTFDHRVSTGREVASFLNQLRTRLLSYALTADNDGYGPAARMNIPGTVNPDSVGSMITCDVCGIDMSAYKKKFARDACMSAYYRDDGSLGSICHVCFLGHS
ncbi:MAG: 2-oxoglutarate dehydrogenase [Chlorobiaceae bacterium]|nr:2-oxoglutarate dehydrogenase [Chlorobiaceae bacterium]